MVTRIVATDGAWVVAGQALAELRDPELEVQRAVTAARVTALEVERFEVMSRETWRLPQVTARLQEALAEQAEIDRRIAGLTIRSALSGRLVIEREADLEGSWVAQGDIFAYVLPRGPLTVRAVVTQEDAAAVRQDTLASSVWFVGGAQSRGLRATAPHEVRSGERRLPSRALADRYGGGIVSDASDPRPCARATVCFFLMSVHRRTVSPSSADVRGCASTTPGRRWATQMLRHAHQMFLAHFDASG
jgi:hypothetical protein